MREDLKDQNLSFTEIAKLVGENWQNLSRSEKAPYETQAHEAKDKYNRDMLQYKETDNYRKYSDYLQDFRKRQAAQGNVPIFDGYYVARPFPYTNRCSRHRSFEENEDPATQSEWCQCCEQGVSKWLGEPIGEPDGERAAAEYQKNRFGAVTSRFFDAARCSALGQCSVTRLARSPENWCYGEGCRCVCG